MMFSKVRKCCTLYVSRNCAAKSIFILKSQLSSFSPKSFEVFEGHSPRNQWRCHSLLTFTQSQMDENLAQKLTFYSQLCIDSCMYVNFPSFHDIKHYNDILERKINCFFACYVFVILNHSCVTHHFHCIENLKKKRILLKLTKDNK